MRVPAYLDAGKLLLHADGTASGPGIAAHWGNRGANVVIVETPGPGLAGGPGGATTAVKTPTGISSKEVPGDWIIGGKRVGLFYAVRVP